MEQVPKIVTERLRAVKPEAHLDANLLAAFAEKSLTSREQARVLEHLAGCALCRDVVAHAHPEPAMQQVAPAPAKKRQPWFRAAALRWGALAACVAIVGTVVITRSHRSQMAPYYEASKKNEETTVAKLEPASPPAASTVSNQVQADRKQANTAVLTTPTERERDQPAPATPQPDVNGLVIAQNEKHQADQGLVGGAGVGGRMGSALGTATAAKPAQADAGARQQQDLRAFDRLDGYAKLQPGAAPAAASANGPQTPRGSAAGENKRVSSGDNLELARVLPPPQSAPKPTDKVSAYSEASTMNAPSPTSQTVQVQASAAPVAMAPPPPVPAQIESASVQQLPVTGREVVVLPEQKENATSSSVLFKSKDVTRGAVGGPMRSGLRLPLPRWQISAEGKLLRSNDAGDTWQPVPVADNVVFRVLSVAGSQLWVGGAQGSLYHSADAGGHWEQVKPAVSGMTLNSDITGIDFPDPRHGKLSTADHQIWTTADGGLSWQLQ